MEEQHGDGNSGNGLPVASNHQDAGALPLDAEKYRKYLEEFDLTEEQETELLSALYSIMKAFVDLGFEVDSVHYLIPELPRNPRDSGASEVQLKYQKRIEKLENAARDSAAKED